MDAFGPIKGAMNTVAVVGTVGSLAKEKGKENQLTEKQQELDRSEAVAKEKQAIVNSEAEINQHTQSILSNRAENRKLGEKIGGALSHYDDQNKIAAKKAAEEALANPGKKVSMKVYGNSIEGIRSRYTSKATGGRMSKEKAMEIQGMRFSQAALRKSTENLQAQIKVKQELNRIREERIKELEGVNKYE